MNGCGGVGDSLITLLFHLPILEISEEVQYRRFFRTQFSTQRFSHGPSYPPDARQAIHVIITVPKS